MEEKEVLHHCKRDIVKDTGSTPNLSLTNEPFIK